MKFKIIDIMIIVWLILFILKTIFFYNKWDIVIYLIVWSIFLIIKTYTGDNKNKQQEDKMKKAGKKVIPVILWIAVVLFVTLIVILISWLITDKTIKTEGQLILILSIIFITIFIIIFTLLVTKYKKEAILNDTERDNKWASLSPGYKRISRIILYASMGIDICLILIGIYFCLYPKPDSPRIEGILWSFFGLMLLFSAYVNLKKFKKLDENIIHLRLKND